MTEIVSDSKRLAWQIGEEHDGVLEVVFAESPSGQPNLDRIDTGQAEGLTSARRARVLEAVALKDSPLLDPEVPMTEDELDLFIATFAEGEVGDKLRGYITAGAICDEVSEGERCVARAVASVDFSGGTVDDSLLTCRSHLRQIYGGVMESARVGEITPEVRINGKLIPKP